MFELKRDHKNSLFTFRCCQNIAVGLLVISIFFLKVQGAFAQQQVVLDSLLSRLEQAKTDSARLNLLHALAWEHIRTDPEKAQEYARQAEELGLKTNDLTGLTSAYNIQGVIQKNKGNYDQALALYQKALGLQKEELKDSVALSACYNNIGSIYFYKAAYATAIEYYFKALQLNEALKDSSQMAKSYTNIGNIFYYQGEIKTAKDYFEKSVRIKERLHLSPRMIGSSYNNLGVVMEDLGLLDSAIFCLEKALYNYELDNEMYNRSSAHLNLASLYISKGDEVSLKKAMESLSTAIDMKMQLKDKDGLSIGFLTMAEIFMVKKRWTQAIIYAKKAEVLSDSIANKQNLKQIYKIASEAYEGSGNYSAALEYYKKYYAINDTIFSKNLSEQLAEAETRYESEKKDKEIELLANQNQLHELHIKHKSNQVWIVILICFLLAMIIVWYIFSTRKSKRTHQIIVEKNNELYQQNEEILAQRDEIERQNRKVNSVNEQLTSSISYAKRIQDALLRDLSQDQHSGLDYFILYRPKDIVSGDFYWVYRKEDFVYFAVVDCTGHGVPGAFLTLLGTSFLNEIADNNPPLLPARILDILRSKVLNELTHLDHGSRDQDVHDGMDVSLLRIDTKAKEAIWSGANCPVYLIEQGKVRKIKGNNQPIGMFENHKPFSNHTIDLNTVDHLYLFSDGYADQFGGPEHKKMGYKRFREILEKIYSKPEEDQQRFLHENFDQWRSTGNEEQVDDVCVIGVRL